MADFMIENIATWWGLAGFAGIAAVVSYAVFLFSSFGRHGSDSSARRASILSMLAMAICGFLFSGGLIAALITVVLMAIADRA